MSKTNLRSFGIHQIFNRKSYRFVVVLFFFATAGYAQQPLTAPKSIPKPRLDSANIGQLQKDIDGIINSDPSTANAYWGISIQSLKNGQFLYKLNSSKSFLPASNMKLITTAAAIDILGPAFEYTTELVTNGKIVKGVLKGDLIIRGSGDPTLGSPSMYPENDPVSIFRQWADTLQKLGITKIEGNIIADDSYFTSDVYPIGWSIDDAPYSYAMQSSGLAFADNSVSVSVSPNFQPGSKPFVAIIPETDYIEKDNNAVTSAPKKKDVIQNDSNKLEVSKVFGTNTITVAGEIAKGDAAVLEQIAVESPSLYAATVFRETLEYDGITITGGTVTAAELEEKIPYKSARTLVQYTSPPLEEIIKIVNKESNNLYAEQLFRTIAKESSGKGSWKEGAAALKKYLTALTAEAASFSIYDGSGLSRMDLITPDGLTAVLRIMHRDVGLRDPFVASLSVMGVDGTLSTRLTGTAAAGNVRAKTGFLTGVRTLSGYVTTKDDELLAFSIFVNNFTSSVKDINNLHDLIMLRLVNFSRK